jgi:hypothetical protein
VGTSQNGQIGGEEIRSGPWRRPRDPIIGFGETTGEPMHDPALSSQDVPAIGGFSLGAKFVGLTAALILLLSLTAFISLRNSA